MDYAISTDGGDGLVDYRKHTLWIYKQYVKPKFGIGSMGGSFIEFNEVRSGRALTRGFIGGYAAQFVAIWCFVDSLFGQQCRRWSSSSVSCHSSRWVSLALLSSRC